MKVLVFTLVALFTCTVAVHLSPNEKSMLNSSRIVGGSNARRYDYPYQISLQYDDGSGFEHICGGSILSPTTIVTAAHCILSTNTRLFRVNAGILNLGENHRDVQTARLASIKVHPDYPGDARTNDLALLTLARALVWTRAVKPINLPRPNTYPSGNAKLSGWGYLSSNRPTPPTTMQQITLPIMGLKECKEAFDKKLGPENNKLNENMVCAGPLTGGKASCTGDSGGPLAQGNTLVGIVSWGAIPCAQVGAPTAYTNPSKYLTYFRRHVKDLQITNDMKQYFDAHLKV